jgi:hypothetical protein
MVNKKCFEKLVIVISAKASDCRMVKTRRIIFNWNDRKQIVHQRKTKFQGGTYHLNMQLQNISQLPSIVTWQMTVHKTGIS